MTFHNPGKVNKKLKVTRIQWNRNINVAKELGLQINTVTIGKGRKGEEKKTETLYLTVLYCKVYFSREKGSQVSPYLHL